ncbi:uncharacterized protein LOC127005091 isoform X5 [Eriocheir sinensis]|uniref:uncharacterized protein LOC127005091 isoform X5 n=1 Tax=Eriocheir sinensis TaxID=95602 RepID=UPI0021C9F5FF|nr:uncharacterized protein LOC127005091 isoform X5 [Eriocheir sinensis]
MDEPRKHSSPPQTPRRQNGEEEEPERKKEVKEEEAEEEVKEEASVGKEEEVNEGEASVGNEEEVKEVEEASTRNEEEDWKASFMDHRIHEDEVTYKNYDYFVFPHHDDDGEEEENEGAAGPSKEHNRTFTQRSSRDPVVKITMKDHNERPSITDQDSALSLPSAEVLEPYLLDQTVTLSPLELEDIGDSVLNYTQWSTTTTLGEVSHILSLPPPSLSKQHPSDDRLTWRDPIPPMLPKAHHRRPRDPPGSCDADESLLEDESLSVLYEAEWDTTKSEWDATKGEWKDYPHIALPSTPTPSPKTSGDEVEVFDFTKPCPSEPGEMAATRRRPVFEDEGEVAERPNGLSEQHEKSTVKKGAEYKDNSKDKEELAEKSDWLSYYQEKSATPKNTEFDADDEGEEVHGRPFFAFDHLEKSAAISGFEGHSEVTGGPSQHPAPASWIMPTLVIDTCAEEVKSSDLGGDESLSEQQEMDTTPHLPLLPDSKNKLPRSSLHGERESNGDLTGKADQGDNHISHGEVVVRKENGQGGDPCMEQKDDKPQEPIESEGRLIETPEQECGKGEKNVCCREERSGYPCIKERENETTQEPIEFKGRLIETLQYLTEQEPESDTDEKDGNTSSSNEEQDGEINIGSDRPENTTTTTQEKERITAATQGEEFTIMTEQEEKTSRSSLDIREEGLGHISITMEEEAFESQSNSEEELKPTTANKKEKSTIVSKEKNGDLSPPSSQEEDTENTNPISEGNQEENGLYLSTTTTINNREEEELITTKAEPNTTSSQKEMEPTPTDKQEVEPTTPRSQEDIEPTATTSQDEIEHKITTSHEDIEHTTTCYEEEELTATAIQEEVEPTITTSQEEVEPTTTFTQKEQEPTTATSQEEAEPLATSQKDVKPSATSQEEVEPSTTSQEEVKPSTTSQEEVEPLATSQEEVEPLASSQEEVEPLASSQEEVEPSATSQEEVEPLATSQEEVEPLATSQEEVEPSATSQEEVEPSATSQEKVEPLATSQDEVEPSATSQEEVEPSATSQEEVEPLATSQEEVEPPATSQEEVEPLATSQEEVEPLATSQEEVEPLATSQEEVEPLATSQEEVEPSATSQEEVEPSATSQEEVEPSATSQEEVEPSATSQEEVEPSATSQEEEEPSATSQEEEPSATSQEEEPLATSQEEEASTSLSYVTTFGSLNEVTSAVWGQEGQATCPPDLVTPAPDLPVTSAGDLHVAFADVMMEGNKKDDDEEEETQKEGDEVHQQQEEEEVVEAQNDPLSWWAWEEVFQGVGESDSSGHSAASRASELAASTTVSPTEAQEEEPGGGGEGGRSRNDNEEKEEEKETNTQWERKSSRGSTGTPTREDQLDAIFHGCDGAARGKVSAGRLADTLSTLLVELQPRWLVGELRDALCSGGEEVELDLPSFRQLLFTWLHENAAHLIPSTSSASTSASPPPDTLLTPSPPPDTLLLDHHQKSPPPFQHQKPSCMQLQSSTQHHHHQYPLVHQSPQPHSTHMSSPRVQHQPGPQHQQSQHHSNFRFLGPLSFTDNLEDWMEDSLPPIPSSPPPPPPPLPPPRSRRSPSSSRNTFEHSLSHPNRRSTLLPRVGGWGAACDAPPFAPLEDMANPPSPISFPRSLFNGAATPRPPAPPRFSPDDDDGGPRSLDRDRGDHHPPHPYNSSHPPYPPPRRYQHHQSHLQHSLNYTYGSIEDEGGVTSPDPGELQQEVLELSHTNKRLTGENQELTTHLTAAEDTNATLREQCVGLRHALQGVQQQLEAARALEAEVEAARRLVEEGKDEREQLLSRLSHLERDNTSLTTRLHTLSKQLNAAQEELDGRTQWEEEAVQRHRDEVGRLSAELAHWKAQAQTQTLAAYRLQETLEDVKKLVEVLREEKRSLEDQLNHVKEELAAATRTESDLSLLDGAEGALALDSTSPEKSFDGSGREKASGAGVTPRTPAAFTTTATNTSAAPTPPPAPSPSVNTPLSIHSEIQTMGEDSGSLPFCEKTEGGSKEERGSCSFSEAGDSPLASVLTTMLRWWREWEERGIPLLRAMLDKDTVALHSHVATHYEELVRLEKELQEIRRVTHSSPVTPGLASLEEALKEGSVGSSTQDSALPSSQATTPTLPKRNSRTPGSHVSHLIYMFESSSQSSSPVCSEASEHPGSVEHPSSLTRMIQRAKWPRRRSYDDGTRSESTNSEDGRSLDHNLRASLENVRCEDNQSDHRRDTCDGHGPESSIDVDGGSQASDHIEKDRDSIFLEYGLDLGEENEEVEEERTKIDIHKPPSTTTQNQNEKKQKKGKGTEHDIEIHTAMTAQSQEEEKQGEDDRMNWSVTVVEDDALEPERDPYMETSHLMKLMNEVAEERAIIKELREQLVVAEDTREKDFAVLQRIYRQVLQVSSETFRWTEGVRRGWLAVVVPRVVGRGEVGEGAESLTPATPTHPLDEVPLTTSFSREEIEALISARLDPPCEARLREEDMHVSSPENLAAELEKELTALRVHVLRSHALLHHYQSSSSGSQYGSRAEVSTPAPLLHHGPGVEVGVECDLCGPTCVPRPCDSTATQTPASPLSSTPEFEEPPTTTLLTTSSAQREEEEEEEARRRREEQEEEERKNKEDKTRGRRQRVKWKEDLENQAEEEEEAVKREEKEEEEEEEEERRDINEGTTTSTQEEQDLLLSVGGGAKDPPHPHPQHRHAPQQAPQQPQRPPPPRQVGVPDLPEHRQLRQVEVLPPAHRTLRQLGVGEEEQQEAAQGVDEGVEIIPMTSEHSLYSPKPAYDHLDHYRSGGQARGTGEEKVRRSGLSTVTPLLNSGEAIPGPPRSRPRAQMELTPLSPPPSLDNVEEEDMEEEEEEEPALPSTPESSSSLASGDVFPHPPQPPRGPPRLPRQMSMNVPDPPPAAGPAMSPPLHPPQQEQEKQQETQEEASPEEEEKKKKVFPSLHDTVLRMAGLARGDPVFTPNTSTPTHPADPGTDTPHPHEQADTPLPALEGVRVGEEVGGGGLVRPGLRGEGKERGKETPPLSGTPPSTPSPVEAARGPPSPERDNLPEKAPPGDPRSPGIPSRRAPERRISRTRINNLIGNATIPEETPEETNGSPERTKPAPKTERIFVRRGSLPEIKTLPVESPEKIKLPVKTSNSPVITAPHKPETETTPARKTSLPETKTSPAESPCKTQRSPERAKPRVTFSPDTKTDENSPGENPIKIRSFSELTDALGIITSPSGHARASIIVSSSFDAPAGMDAELPVPEQLSCLYDVVKAVKNSNENLSPQEIETKFTQLSLAFKTDRLTLRQRLDLQQRHRDTAENNHEADMECLRRYVWEIQAECTDPEVSDAISRLRRHLDILAATSSRLVSTSEVWGAVQQEWRLARAVEVIFRHVEDVKRKYESVKQELEELRGLLTDYKIELPVSHMMGSSAISGCNNLGASDSPSTSRRIRALSLAGSSNKAGSEKEGRRVSLVSSKTSSSGFAGSARSRGRRASLMPDLKPFREPLAAVAAASAVAAFKESSSSSSSSSGSGPTASKEQGEEVPGTGAPPSRSLRRWNCSITEEASESGEEEGGSSSQDNAPSTAAASATATTTAEDSGGSYSNLSPLSPDTLSRLQALAEMKHGSDDSDDRASDDQSQSEVSQGSLEDYQEPPPPSFTASLWNRLESQHWLVVAIKEVLAWAKGGQWPYSHQQTVLGARYAFTTLLLFVAALFLLVTLSSGNASVRQPRHHGWTTLHHLLHPFVSLRYLDPPPT